MYECFNCSFYVGYGYSCPVCGKNFSNIATIRGHYKYTHWMDLPPREEIESWRIGSTSSSTSSPTTRLSYDATTTTTTTSIYSPITTAATTASCHPNSTNATTTSAAPSITFFITSENASGNWSISGL
jgi:hypothetical protein